MRKRTRSALHVLTLLFFAVFALTAIVGTALSSPTHNSDQFACNLPTYVSEHDCIYNSGTWNPSRKWAGGWGVSGGEYGEFKCQTCHMKNPPNGNIKRIRSQIVAPEGDFPGGGVVDVKDTTELGNDSDNHESSERVCEVCHSKTSYHRFDTTGQTGGNTHYNLSDCILCHRHNDGFRPDCSSCHGNSYTRQSWPDGNIANNVTDAYAWADDEAGSHDTHVRAIGTGNSSCDYCHPGNPPVGHYEDNTTGVEQAEVIRMDTNDDGGAEYWDFLEGPTAFSGTAVYFKNSAGLADTDAYYRFDTSIYNSTCYNIDCHGGFELQWDAKNGCLICHAVEQGSRAAVVDQFGANSHHVQETTLSSTHCYQCHWEANSDGTINPDYHGGIFNSGSEVDLVVYGAGIRPNVYNEGTTALRYAADGSRTEIESLNKHCLGCHSEQNSTTLPFADGKTPEAYAWDGTSVGTRYSQTGSVTWGKYTSVPNAAKKDLQKAYSAHGNAGANAGGWDAATGVDGIITNTRAGTSNVACFDCHNSHGSRVEGITTSYNSATVNGGLLKDTASGYGGYVISYQPVAGGANGTSNIRNPGASLCFDCHLNADGGTALPWGYQSTFGAAREIIGYYDSLYFAPGSSGPKVRYPYKAATSYKGGHFGASSPLTVSAMGSIDGLCTPCHDPHGVSTTLGINQKYGVPMLKGTWLTSPYQEDVAPASALQTQSVNSKPYHIDQNTFGLNITSLVAGITETDQQFAGLCLNCHPKASLTGGTRTWRSKDRIHESVKGWKPSGTIKHRYSCSKCHSPHMGSVLPRLMVTNCLDPFQKGRGSATTRIQVYGENDWGGYEGQIPKSRYSTTCHEAAGGSAYGGLDQRWNLVTPYNDDPAPVITSGPTFTNSSYYDSYFQYWELAATINWSTNAMSHSMVEYGPTTAYGMREVDNLAVSHSVGIIGLANHTTYHYRVRSMNNLGEEVISADQMFTISIPPRKPVPSPEPDVVSLYNAAVNLSWSASVNPGNAPVEYFVQVDDNSDFSSVFAESGWISVRNFTTPELTAATTWYWRVMARDRDHPASNSGWSIRDDFKIHVPPPTIPVLNDRDHIQGGEGTTAALTWNPSTTEIAGGTLDYYLEVSTDKAFGTVLYNSGWGSDTGWSTPGLGTDEVYFWRVKARYDISTPITTSGWSAVDRFVVTEGIPSPPSVTLLAPANGTRFETAETQINATFQWQSVPPADAYSVVVVNDNGGAVVASSGWITSTSWTTNITPEYGGYGHITNFTWSVVARDAITKTVSAPVYGTFYNWDSGTCPFLYTWDGEKFAFEADLYPGGKLATKTSRGYLKPNPHDYYLLRHKPVEKDGVLELRIVEERYETDYLDELKFYTVDVPDDRVVFPELPLMGTMEAFPGLENVLHSVSVDARAPKIIHVNTGEDVTRKLAANDNDFLVLSNDRNLDFTYQTLELDLGDVQLAPQVKIVMDALSMFPTSPEGVARAASFGARTILEVQDETGNWVTVPNEVMTLPKPYEFTRPYLFDISDIWVSDSRKVRFSFLFKTYVDWIIVDTTADQPITLREVPMLSAELNLHGPNPKSNDGELYEYVYSEANNLSAYMPGAHTRFGDVEHLLGSTDDKFVIYGGGDQIVMTFEPPAPAGQGVNRSLLIYTNGYYKDKKVNVPHTVEPLPFAAMSNFPYDEAVENYPVDAEHNAYRAEYNTRVIAP